MTREILTRENLTGQTYLTGRGLGFDLEVDGDEAGHALNLEARIVCLSYATTDGEAADYYGDIADCKRFWELLEECDYLVAWNGKYEAHWLLRLGIDPANYFWADPMLFEWVLLGNNVDDLSLSLEAAGPRYGTQLKDARVALMFEHGVRAGDIPDHWLIDRCHNDVDMQMHVMMCQLEELERRGLLHLAATRCLHMVTLTHMEKEGNYLDKSRVVPRHLAAQEDLTALRLQLNALCGGEVNERSPNIMVPLVYGMWPEGTQEKDKTLKSLGFKEPADRGGNVKRGKPNKSWPEGRPLLNKHVIRKLETQAKTKRQREWIELRGKIGKAGALLSKNLDFFRGVVEEDGGKFHVELMQGVTATHRLSGRGRPRKFKMFNMKPKSVQSQNMPRELKTLQVAPPGRKAWDVDGSQLEFRGAAFLGNDKQAKADIENPRFDAHIQTLAVKHYGCKVRDDGTIEGYDDLFDRYKAGDKQLKYERADNEITKSHTFKPLFGGEKGTPEEEAYYKFFNARYKGIVGVQAGWLKDVEQGEPVTVITGLQFTFRTEQRRGMCFSTITGKPIKPSVYNYPIQYFSTGEMIPIATIWLFYTLRKKGIDAVLSNTVHDSVSGHVRPEQEGELREVAQKCFTHYVWHHLKEIYGIDYDVALGVECTIGSHVGEGTSTKFDWRHNRRH